ALKLEETRAVSPAQQVAAYVKDRHLLLILDNFEHLLPAAAARVGALLAGAPRVKILVTSREPLKPPCGAPSGGGGVGGARSRHRRSRRHHPGARRGTLLGACPAYPAGAGADCVGRAHACRAATPARRDPACDADRS